jgi:hypothetical protein
MAPVLLSSAINAAPMLLFGSYRYQIWRVAVKWFGIRKLMSRKLVGCISARNDYLTVSKNVETITLN